ncbi:MAG: methyltransferase [Segetibacter sp.]|nr:methyltransferase [Segetibacter sp.]
MQDVLGEAIYDYYHHQQKGKLWIHNKYGRKEEMPVDIYFRDDTEMPQLELFALLNCKGKVLDIGAGAGSHALALQQKGMDVTAVEISPKAAAVMQERGVENIIQQDIWTLQEERYDTLLLLMNGIGLAATLNGLTSFLQHAKKLLYNNGQLLFDSSDVAYLYKGKLPEGEKYYGEILYQYEYKKQKTDWFSWLYVDRKTLTTIAAKEGWTTTILFEDEYDQFLAKLQLAE